MKISPGIEMEALPLSDSFLSELKGVCDDYIRINSENFDIREVEISAVVALIDHVFKILCRHRSIRPMVGFGAAASFVFMFIQEMRDMLPVDEKPKFNKYITRLMKASMDEIGLK